MLRCFRYLVFAAAALAVQSASAATVTLSDTWQNLGSGPLLLQTFGCDALVEASASAPTDAGHALYRNQTPFAYNTTLPVWAKRRTACTNNAGALLASSLVYSAVGGGGVALPTQGATANWSQPTDVSCAATTVCSLTSNTARKYWSVVNTTATGSCRVAYGGVTPAANRGDPVASAANGQGGSRTFENSYVPQGAVSAFCTAASTLAVMEGN